MTSPTSAASIPPGTGAGLLLAGPTASGKSAVALSLAGRWNAEIVSADSMQVYRGLDVGTAKPSLAERAAVPHHLVDVVGLTESFDAARWLALAQTASVEIRRRGRVPIFCGGTGLYFRAWTQGLDAPAPVDSRTRSELESRPLAELLAELEARDPVAFQRLDRNNPRRVVRAVEILRAAGSGERRIPAAMKAPDPAPIVVLQREAGDLRRRIEARVDLMFAAGLVEETRRLLAAGLAENRTAMQAIGYRQVVEHLRGEYDLAAAIALVKVKTWQYARRQRTWFRHQLAARILDVAANESAEVTASRVADLIEAPTGVSGRGVLDGEPSDPV